MADTPLQLPVRLTLQGALRPGGPVEVRLMLGHAMETGFRHDSSGKRVSKNILDSVVVRLDDAVIFEAELGTGMAANPMLFFSMTLPALPAGGAALEVQWTDDQGRRGSMRKALVFE